MISTTKKKGKKRGKYMRYFYDPREEIPRSTLYRHRVLDNKLSSKRPAAEQIEENPRKRLASASKVLDRSAVDEKTLAPKEMEENSPLTSALHDQKNMTVAELKAQIPQLKEEIQSLREQIYALEHPDADRNNRVGTSTVNNNKQVKRQLFTSGEPQRQKTEPNNRISSIINEFSFPPDEFNYEQESNKICSMPCMEPYTTQDGEDMLHLAFGHSIKISSWGHVKRKLSKKTDIQKMAKHLIRQLYEKNQLANRCIVLREGMNKYGDRESPRKTVTPTKMYAVRVSLGHLLREEKKYVLQRYEVEAELDLIKSYVSSDINYHCGLVKQEARNNQ